MTPKTLPETTKLLDLSRRKAVPVSFGIAPETFDLPICGKEESGKNLYWALSFINHYRFFPFLIGDRVINSRSYFFHVANLFHCNRFYMDHFPSIIKKFECDIGRYFIQVATDGNVYRCSKLQSVSDTFFLDLDKDYFKNDGHNRKELLSTCQRNCYSACAYSTSLIRRSPFYLLETINKMG